ncbi:MAG: peptidoglycan-binding protein [Jaaginema sp. PMC 1079.18]|nr:peptidoglycan-binding protein [Jaaginema sp. PMC 1080.18]MEC4853624.1 peptidoglycan-binding protein [Jaaginema sp. PMC 1079.18]MEC4866951.1 peptidoglycan-binding protein [Jaaginema sp. PMC 1078.18]
MESTASNSIGSARKMRLATPQRCKMSHRGRSRFRWVWQGFWGAFGAIAFLGTAYGQQMGDAGAEVTRLQMRLQVLGYSQVQSTGIYDIATQKAVRDFQLSHGLAVDGIVGSQTRSLLFQEENPNLTPIDNFDLFPSASEETVLFPDSAIPFDNEIEPDFVPVANPNTVPSFPLQETVAPPNNANNAIAQIDNDTFWNQGLYGRSRPVLKQNSQNSFYVRELQRLLRDRGYYWVEVDGVFGDQTLNAVKQFQGRAGLDPDGVVGWQTWGALLGNATPSRPSTTSFPNPNTSQQNNQRYVVVVPGGFEILDDMRREGINISFDSVMENRRGRYIQVQRFESRELAESLSYYIRSEGFDARVIYE